MVVKIGNIIADIEEFIPFKETISRLGDWEIKREHNYDKLYAKLKKGEHELEIVTIHSDIGKSAAAAATAYLIAEGCDYIINSGLSGAISGVGVEDIVVASDCIMSDFDVEAISSEKGSVSICELPLKTDDKLREIFLKSLSTAKVGRFSTADSFICNKEIKNSLRNMGVTACDMESAAIAYTCMKADVPFLTFRRISDDADDLAYDSYRQMNTEKSVRLFEITVGFLQQILETDEIFK